MPTPSPCAWASAGRRDSADTRSWQDFPTYAEAEAAGALLIRQDVRLLEHILKLGVDGALRLIEEGLLVVRRSSITCCVTTRRITSAAASSTC